MWLAGALAQPQPSIQELMDGGHYKRARDLIEERYRQTPNDAETLYLLSRVRQIWGKLDEAEKLAEKAIALSPKEARYHYQLAETVGQKAQRASVLHQIGLGRTFKKEADTALQLDPRHVGALKDMMMFYLMAPGVIGGDQTKARGMADRIMQVDRVEGYFAQITLAQHEKQPDRVEELLTKAVEARPGSYDAHTSLAGYLLGRKQFEEAERHARGAVRLHPDRAGAHAVVSAKLAARQNWSGLDAALADAEKAVPDNRSPTSAPRTHASGRRSNCREPKVISKNISPWNPSPAPQGTA